MDKRSFGSYGEKLAEKYFEKYNYKFLDKNWHFSKYGELDLIIYDLKTKEIVFVEVKSRKSSLGDAKELVTLNKQKQIARIARAYLHFHSLNKNCYRFDVVAICVNNGINTLQHIKNAFILDLRSHVLRNYQSFG